MSYLNEHSIPAIIAIIFCVLLYIDGGINMVKRTGRDYLKSFVVVYCLAYLAIYLYNNNIGSGNKSLVGGLFARTPLREEIFIGNPNF